VFLYVDILYLLYIHEDIICYYC